MSYYSSVILADSPVRYYRLGELSGTTAVDSSSSSQNGTITGGVTENSGSLIANDSNPSMTFDGSTGYISVPMTGLPTGASSWSIEAWVKMPILTTGTFQSIASFGTQNSQQEGALYFQGGSGNNLFTLSTYSGDISSAPNSVTAGSIYHVVATYDGTHTRLYVNGVLAATGTFTLNVALAYASIGSDGTVPADFFSGLIDEVAIYSTALNQSQITAHYNAGFFGSVLITNDGLNLIRNAISGGDVAKITYVAIGTSNTTPTNSDHTLNNEVFRKAVTSYTNGTTGEILVDVYLAPGDCIGVDIEEIGFFGGASASLSANSGVLFAHALYSHPSKLATESIQLQMDFIA